MGCGGFREMKIYDFGLWFYSWRYRKWFTTIPEEDGFYIYYDGVGLGLQSGSSMEIWETRPHIINLKKHVLQDGFGYSRRLTLDDFENIPNPSYRSPP